MFSATAMTPEERRRMALEMARLRVARVTSRGAPSRRLPSALPCHDYAKAFAHVTMPMGVVEMSDAAELQPWLLVARPVSRKEAEKKGGCIRFTPSTSTADKVKSGATVKPSYFCITDTDDEVYGRAAYLPRPTAPATMKKCVSTESHESSSCRYECTEEDEEDVSAGSGVVTPHRRDSCRCAVRA